MQNPYPDPASGWTPDSGRPKFDPVPMLVVAGLLIVALAGVAGGVFLYRQLNASPSTHPYQAQSVSKPYTLPPILSAVNSAGPVITPDQAEAVVRAWWPLNEQALAENNTIATDQLETAAFAQFSDGETQDILGRRNSPAWRNARPLEDLRLFVPKQLSFPASFLAIVKTTVAPGDPNYPKNTLVQDTLVFVRPSADRPWKAALRESVLPYRWPPDLTPTAKPGDVYEAQLQGPYVVDPRTVPNALAAYWQNWYSIGAAPADSIFAPGFATTELGQKSFQEHYADEARNGVKYSRSYTDAPGADGLFQFRVNGDSDLTCFTIRFFETDQSAQPNGVLHQDPNRTNWGGWLEPGIYSTIQTSAIRQTCALIPPLSSDGQVSVEGYAGGDYLTTGKKAS